jgi:hypothetical protein
MTNAEIGSYLRLATETVDSELSELAAAGMIGLEDGAVSLEDRPGLAQLVDRGRQPNPDTEPSSGVASHRRPSDGGGHVCLRNVVCFRHLTS